MSFASSSRLAVVVFVLCAAMLTIDVALAAVSVTSGSTLPVWADVSLRTGGALAVLCNWLRHEPAAPSRR